MLGHTVVALLEAWKHWKSGSLRSGPGQMCSSGPWMDEVTEGQFDLISQGPRLDMTRLYT